MAQNEASKARLKAQREWATSLESPHTEHQAEVLCRDIEDDAGGFSYAPGYVGYPDGSVLHIKVVEHTPWDDKPKVWFVSLRTYGCR